MVEVTVDSIRVSLISHHRVVVLKEAKSNRFLPIWIGQFEADAITLGLQGVEVARPLTHDLIKSILDETGATVSHILVNELQDDTFYARIVVGDGKKTVTLDSRPSDAIAIAVRAGCPIMVDESVFARCQTLTKPISEEEVGKFKEELKNLKPEDIFKDLKKAPPAEGEKPPKKNDPPKNKEDEK